MTENEILKYALEHGMIDITTIYKDVEMNKRKKILSEHNYGIWQDKKGNYFTYLNDETKPKKRRMIKRKVMADLEDAIVQYYESVGQHYFAESFMAWGTQRVEYGEIMKQTYDRYVKEYNRYIKDTELDRTPLDEIDDVFLEDFIKRTIHDQKIYPNRWASLNGIFKGTFRYARKHGYTDFDYNAFLNDIDLPKKIFEKTKHKDEDEVFTEAEVQAIENYIKSRKKKSATYTAILFAFYSGLRVGELSAIKHSDIKGNVLTVSRTEEAFLDENDNLVTSVRESTKGRGESRRVFLTQKALDVYNSIDKTDEYVFVNKHGERIKGNSISWTLRSLCKKIGIPPRSIHKARKTYATELINAGVPEKIVMNQMGHTTIATTKTYYYFNNHNDDEVTMILNRALRGSFL